MRKSGIGSSWGEASWARKAWTLLTVAATVGFVVAAGGAEPAALQASASRSDLVRFAGRQPDRCVYSAPNRELCRWKIEGRLIRPGHANLRSVLGSVNLLCDVPIGPRSEAEGACVILALEPGAVLSPTHTAAPAITTARTASAANAGIRPRRLPAGAFAGLCVWAAPGEETA